MGADSGIVRELLDLSGMSVAPGDRLDSYEIVGVGSGATPAPMTFERVAEKVLCNAELFKQVTQQRSASARPRT